MHRNNNLIGLYIIAALGLLMVIKTMNIDLSWRLKVNNASLEFRAHAEPRTSTLAPAATAPAPRPGLESQLGFACDGRQLTMVERAALCAGHEPCLHACFQVPNTTNSRADQAWQYRLPQVLVIHQDNQPQLRITLPTDMHHNDLIGVFLGLDTRGYNMIGANWEYQADSSCIRLVGATDSGLGLEMNGSVRFFQVDANGSQHRFDFEIVGLEDSSHRLSASSSGVLHLLRRNDNPLNPWPELDSPAMLLQQRPAPRFDALMR